MHLEVAVLKLKSNESELAKKKCTFLDYFFFNRSLKLVHLHLFWARLQYSYEGRFTMSTYHVYLVDKVLLLSTTL